MAFFNLSNIGLGARDGSAPAPVAPAEASGSGAAGGSQAGSRGKDETLNQASVNNEAALLQGGYNAQVETAVEASRGVGVSKDTVKTAAAEYARLADAAVREGRPASEIRFDDPNLTQAAKDAMYAEAAQQNGKTPEEINQQAEQTRQADMQAIQQGVGGLVGGAGLIGALDSIAGQGQPAQVQAQPQQAAAAAPNPFGISGDVMAMLRGSMVDMGPTTAALSSANFRPMDTPGMAQQQQGRGI